MSNFAAMLAFLLVFVLTSNYYSDDAQIFHNNYCANVAVWELDEDVGIDPYERAGHPNYKGVECDQEKD